jgi:hypothetical protein
MNRTIALACWLCLVAGSALAADAPPEMTPEQKAEMEAYMKAGTPGEPHRMLAAGVGTYDVVVKSYGDPDAPPMVDKGTAVRTLDLDGRIVVERMNCTMMGMPFTGTGMTGFDNVSGKYWATWTDSMSTGIMLSEGTCDAQHACTFVGSWNDPVKGRVTSRMVSRRVSPGVETFEMYSVGKDGKETRMMEMTYTRK